MNSDDSTTTQVVLEIADALDPIEADRKYTEPLRQRLLDHQIGKISSVEQGKSNTPAEFSRIITVELSDYDAGMEVVQEFLVDTEAPTGTLVQSCDSAGKPRDIFMLGPPDHDG